MVERVKKEVGRRAKRTGACTLVQKGQTGMINPVR